jgi:predicted phosphodiesterase
MKLKFAVISDTQIGDEIQERYKLNAVKVVLEEKPEFVLFPGDLTTHGWNACWFNWIIKKLFFPQETYRYEKELGKFVNQFILPIEKNGIKTYSVMGNHDTYNGPILPVKCWIKKKHGNTHYKVKYNDKLDIYGLGIYPTNEICDWLSKNLDDNKFSILFFHYPTSGDYSDWWGDDEKEYFYNTIKDRKILTMATGHFHTSTLYDWKEYTLINGAGSTVAIVDVDLDTGDVDVVFK